MLPRAAAEPCVRWIEPPPVKTHALAWERPYDPLLLDFEGPPARRVVGDVERTNRSRPQSAGSPQSCGSFAEPVAPIRRPARGHGPP